MKYPIIIAAAFASILFSIIYSLTGNAEDAAPPINFSHELHVKMNGMECATCHEGVSTSATGKDDLLPKAEVCKACHEDVDNPELVPKITDYNVKFNHKTHIEKGHDCGLCHAGVESKPDASITNRHLPDMAFCMTCHEVPEEIEGCMLCHTEDEDLTPASHTELWESNHGNFRASRDECLTCHQENFCIQCHSGENLFNETHRPDFIITHPMAYMAREKNCAACHEGLESCRECHMELNRIFPLSHQMNGWLFQHRQTAFPDQCVVCHTEDDPTCIQCHYDNNFR